MLVQRAIEKTSVCSQYLFSITIETAYIDNDTKHKVEDDNHEEDVEQKVKCCASSIHRRVEVCFVAARVAIGSKEVAESPALTHRACDAWRCIRTTLWI